MYMMKYTLPGLMLLTAAACSNSGADYTPIVDGTRSPSFHADLEQCQAVSMDQKLIDGNTRTDALVAAGLGAAVGGLEEGLEGAVAGGVIGGLAGTGSGALEARERRQDIIIECMQQRGHRVVG